MSEGLFTYPPQAAFDRVIPKTKIYSHAKPTRHVRDRFTSDIVQITWKYKLAPETINVLARPGVPEIQIFTVALKPTVEIPARPGESLQGQAERQSRIRQLGKECRTLQARMNHNELKRLFGIDKIMDYPKPTLLIKRLAQIAIGSSGIVVEFSAGSATTAEAVMKLNAEDGMKHQYIMAQLPEACPEQSAAYKACFDTGIDEAFVKQLAEHGSEDALMTDPSWEYPPAGETPSAGSAGHGDDPPQTSAVRYYYVDEAGDPVLFNAKGRMIAGQPGCSRFFILGKAEVMEPDGLADAMNELRRKLLADPYFAGVPSMSPERRKTARMFHAKDDPAEVRREVFHLLLEHDIRFYAVVREKQTIAEKVLDHQRSKPAYRYHPNQLYDRCVTLLFKDRLHQHEAYRIVFARRGSSDRTEAFAQGLKEAKMRFWQKWGIENAAPIEVLASDPVRFTCLQAADYFLWALQRCFERGEHRYLDMLWSKIGLIIDQDDTRKSGAGEYYPNKRKIPQGFRQIESNPSAEQR